MLPVTGEAEHQTLGRAWSLPAGELGEESGLVIVSTDHIGGRVMGLAFDEEMDALRRPERLWPAAAAEGEDLVVIPREVADREAVGMPAAPPGVVKHHELAAQHRMQWGTQKRTDHGGRHGGNCPSESSRSAGSGDDSPIDGHRTSGSLTMSTIHRYRAMGNPPPPSPRSGGCSAFSRPMSRAGCLNLARG